MSSCKISSKMKKRFRDIAIYDFKVIDLGLEGQHASACKITSKLVIPLLRYSNFSRWRPSAILDLLGRFSDDHQRVVGGL